eukprot:5050428-Ditylum_brightwellii.AAC.1
MQWLQRAEVFPYTQKGKACVYLPGDSRDFNKQDVFVVVPATVVFIVFINAPMELFVCYWVYFDPVTHSKTHPSPRPNSSYLWKSTAKLLLDS